MRLVVFLILAMTAFNWAPAQNIQSIYALQIQSVEEQAKLANKTLSNLLSMPTAPVEPVVLLEMIEDAELMALRFETSALELRITFQKLPGAERDKTFGGANANRQNLPVLLEEKKEQLRLRQRAIDDRRGMRFT